MSRLVEYKKDYLIIAMIYGITVLTTAIFLTQKLL